MTKKIIVILTALLLASSLCACSGGKGNGETTAPTGTVNVEGSTGSENATGDETGTSSTNPNATAANPGEYSYTDCDDTVYVKSTPATLRTADYEAKGSVASGTELKRVGISTSNDEFDGYWSKVIYEEETYYVASKLVTTMKNPDEGFVEITKTVTMAGNLVIRDIPDMSGSDIGYANKGEEIKVLAENTTIGWYKVEFTAYGGETAVGYIASDAKYFVSETATAETSAAE